jgi:hypothetical protein
MLLLRAIITGFAFPAAATILGRVVPMSPRGSRNLQHRLPDVASRGLRRQLGRLGRCLTGACRNQQRGTAKRR